MFIALGSTATLAVGKMIDELRVCGIYDDDDRHFRDRFVAIDTDRGRISDFGLCGDARHISTIHVPESGTQKGLCPAVKTIVGGAYNGSLLLRELNADWANVAVQDNGVGGDRRCSYADLSWSSTLRKLAIENFLPQKLKEYTQNSEDIEIVVVSSCFGGSASGFFFNVGELIRSIAPRCIPVYAMIIVPDLGFTSDKVPYKKGWLNFCNFWQQMKQSLWERRLGTSGSKYVFPFYAGMTQEDFDKKLFPLKYDIENFMPNERGVKSIFNRVFPIMPPNPYLADKEFVQNAAAEMAIFLFYQGFARTVPKTDDNFMCQEHENELLDVDMANFAELNLISARCSPDSLYYQAALRKFNELGQEFFCENSDTIQAVNIDSADCADDKVTDAIEDCKKNLHNKLRSFIKLAEDAIAGSEAVKLSSFGDFIVTYRGSFSSLPQAVKSYENLVGSIKNAGTEKKVKGLKKNIESIIDNADDIAERWQKTKFAIFFDKDNNIEASIKEQADNLLKSKLDDYFKAYIAYQRIEHLNADLKNRQEKLEKENRTAGNSGVRPLFSDVVSRSVLNGESNIAAIRYKEYSDKVTGINPQDDFFGSIVKDKDSNDTMNRSLAEFPLDMVRGKFVELFCQLVKEARLNENSENADAAISMKTISSFHQKIADAVEAIKEWHKANKAKKPQIDVKIKATQIPYLADTVEGEDRQLFYVRNDGDLGEEAPIKFKIEDPTLGEDVICRWGLENFQNVQAQLPAAISQLTAGSMPDDIDGLRQNDYKLDAVVTQVNDSNGNKVEVHVLKAKAVLGNGEIDLQTPAKVFSTRSTIADVVDRNRYLLGLWVGQSTWGMTAEQVVFSKSYLKADPPSNSQKFTSIILSTKYMDEGMLRSRLLFSLREDLFLGMILGIIQERARTAINKLNGGVDPATKVEVTIDFTTDPATADLGKLPIGGEIEEVGFDLGGNFVAAPFELMIYLSGLFRRQSGNTSRFARAFGIEDELEKKIDRDEEWYLLRNMKMSIPKEIGAALAKLRERCEKFITVNVAN